MTQRLKRLRSRLRKAEGNLKAKRKLFTIVLRGLWRKMSSTKSLSRKIIRCLK